MTIQITRISAEGQYLSTSYCDEGALQHEDTSLIYRGHARLREQYHDFVNNTPVDMPPCPGEHFVFDYKNKCWQMDIVSAWRSVKNQRNTLLSESDWVLLRAADQGSVPPAEWMTYRQALRDITTQPDPFNIQWPVMPGVE